MPKLSLLFTLLFSSMLIRAHSFHVGMAHVDYEEEKEMLFCTLQLEYADFAHWIEDLGVEFNLNELANKQQESEDWERFHRFISIYFHVESNWGAIDLHLFSIELELDGRLFVYLYAENVKPFDRITWKYALLMGHSMEQQNKLEFKYIGKEKNTTQFAYFFENELTKTLIINKN